MKGPLALALLLASSPAVSAVQEGLVARLKPVVVNVEKSVQVGIDSESPGISRASGFIVDAKRGIIATNRHVTGSSPARFKIVFENGQSTDARLLHYDAWHDIGLLKIDAEKLGFKLAEAELGDSFALKEQDDVVLIGNNDAEEYSVKFGKVSNLVLDKGDRHTATLQTTFDRAGGSSGSPVFDAKGKVVAVHFAGTQSTSFELRVEYLKDALRQLQSGGPVRRGDVGLDLDLILVSDARKHFHLPEPLAKKVMGLRKDLKRMAVVESRVPGLPAYVALQPGDLILSVDGVVIGDDLYRFDRIVDGKLGGEVEVGAVRNGREFAVKLKVADAEALKTTEFAQFAGGVLQDPTPELRRRNSIENPGVFMTRAERGSSFATLGYALDEESDRTLVLIEGVNGTPTPDLKTFLDVVRPLKDREHIYVLLRDKHSHNSNIRAKPVTLDLKFSPLKVTRWSPADLEWAPGSGQ